MMKNKFYTLLIVSFILSCGTENNPEILYSFAGTPSTVGGGTIEPSSGQYSEGTLLEVMAIPSEGWEFIRWEGDLTESNNPTEFHINKNYNVVAVFVTNGIDEDTEIVEVTSVTGRVWMDRNLGASRVATSSTDSQAYGDLYQWGRSADGHQKRNSPIISVNSSFDKPGHRIFITNNRDGTDWRNPQNSNLWGGVNGINNPCPEGYRIPTETEWEAERDSWSNINSTGAFGSILRLPEAGLRFNTNGSLSYVGSNGFYWSSVVSGTSAMFLEFHSNYALIRNAGNRASGFSVRCIKD